MKRSILLLMAVLFSIRVFSQEQQIKVSAWVTSADRTKLLQQQDGDLFLSNTLRAREMPIVIDDGQAFQQMDGFGYALTGGSAEHLIRMSAPARKKLLKEIFDTNNVSYLRLTIGASDLNSFVFSYDDLKDGETDVELKHFSLSQDLKDVIPIMKEILSIQPGIKIMASPWSAPAWMKTNGNVRGGALKKEYYGVYAQYFVKYIQAMQQHGIDIGAVTVQNEPLNSRNTPSMQWKYKEQLEFIRDHLGPAFAQANIKSKIILFDHNLDRIDYPLALLNDPKLAQYVDGSGFHNYGGDMGAMSIMHMARPDKNIYFTEQMVIERGGADAPLDIVSPVKRLVIGAGRNWSKNLILWNLAADFNNDPHTDNGGCGICQGALSIEGDKVQKNVAYYTIAHVSTFVPSGSWRIASTNTGDPTLTLTEDEEQAGIRRATIIHNTDVLPNVAFRRPDGKVVLVVANDTWNKHAFSIQYHGMYANLRLAPGSVGTFLIEQE
ncbi:glucosylceramidase [Chitinophaga caeni]|uniref:Glucosylceramidase n=1 Tax=Chitinophaga caeni TaxID=2029983 RepID=A0A291QY89_9BACT|nr:glycoside hydrolase family 30 beta sandwich domain-containing protein [Chitinophaga caeni]ATL48908.1 glucosylceramidase [Chitinophaga caeni]